MVEPSERAVSITLSPAQVEQVVRAATRSSAPGISILISGAVGARATGRGRTPADDAYSDRRLSRSLLRGLSILTCFEAADEERGIVELSRAAGMSPSTAHRYALTLIELGLLERSPSSRRYRLPATA
jgi:hypothetical protein